MAKDYSVRLVNSPERCVRAARLIWVNREWTGEYGVPYVLLAAFDFMARRVRRVEGIIIDRFIVRTGRDDYRIVWLGPDEIIDTQMGPADVPTISMSDPWSPSRSFHPLVFDWPSRPGDRYRPAEVFRIPVEVRYLYNLRPLAGGSGKLLIRSLRDVVETASYWES